MGRVKQKCAFEHAQDAQNEILQRMPKVSSGIFLSIHTSVVSNNFVLADSKGPNQSDLGHRCPHILEDMFSHVTRRNSIIPVPYIKQICMTRRKIFSV